MGPAKFPIIVVNPARKPEKLANQILLGMLTVFLFSKKNMSITEPMMMIAIIFLKRSSEISLPVHVPTNTPITIHGISFFIKLHFACLL